MRSSPPYPRNEIFYPDLPRKNSPKPEINQAVPWPLQGHSRGHHHLARPSLCVIHFQAIHRRRRCFAWPTPRARRPAAPAQAMATSAGVSRMSSTRRSWRPCTGPRRAPRTCTSTTTTTTSTPPAWSRRRRWQCRFTYPCRGPRTPPRSPCRRQSRTARSPSRRPVSAASALAEFRIWVSVILPFGVSPRLFLGFWCALGSVRWIALRSLNVGSGYVRRFCYGVCRGYFD